MSNTGSISEQDVPTCEQHFVSTRFGDLHYVVYGDRSDIDLVFFHGANMGIAQWTRNLVLLQERYRIILLDHFNSGESASVDPGTLTPRDFVDGAEAVLRHADVRRSVLIGHSFGGWIAAKLALSNSGGAQALVLVDPVGIGNRLSIPQRLLARPALSRSMLSTFLRGNSENMRRFIASGFRKGYTAPREFIASITRDFSRAPKERNPYAFSAMISKHFDELKLETELIQSHFPTLIVVGEDDPMADVVQLKKFGDTAASWVTLAVIAGSAHVPNMEQESVYNECLSNFLRTLTTTKT